MALSPDTHQREHDKFVLDGAGNTAVRHVESTIPVYATESFQATFTSADATTAAIVKAKTAAKKIYITDLIISSASAINIQLQDDAPTVLMEQVYFPANSIFSKSFKTPLVVDTNKDLNVIASGAGAISVTVTGYVI